MKPFLRWLFPRLMISATTMILLLVVMEITLRLIIFGTIQVHRPERYRDFDPVLGWRLQPNANVIVQDPEYEVNIQINSHGLRDVDHSYTKPPGVYRVVILGDSFMEAYQVELAQSLPRLLEDHLNEIANRPVEVINLGVGGYSTAQEYLMFMQEGRRYQPDLVLLAFFTFNDVATNTYPLAQRLMTEDDYKLVAAPFAQIMPDDTLTVTIQDVAAARQRVSAAQQRSQQQEVWEASVLWEQSRMVAGRLHLALQRQASIRDLIHIAILRDGLWFNVFGCHQDDEWTLAWDVTIRLLQALDQEAASIGAEFGVFTVPSLFEVSAEERAAAFASYENLQPECTDLTFPAHQLATAGVPLLDLTPIFQAHGGNLHFTRIDRHWTAEGHAVAAQAVADWVQILWKIPTP